VSYGSVVLRSLTWPGAVSIYNKGEITQIYVGSGLKLEDRSQSSSQNFPLSPPVLNLDPEEYELSEDPKDEPVPEEKPAEGEEGDQEVQEEENE